MSRPPHTSFEGSDLQEKWRKEKRAQQREQRRCDAIRFAFGIGFATLAFYALSALF